MRATQILLFACLAIHANAGGIYWTDRNTSGTKAIRTANFDGSSPAALFDLGSSADPRGIVVVPATGKLYYASRTNPVGILVANLDGTGTPASVIASGLSAPADLRYLPPSGAGQPGLLYVADESGGAIRRVGTDGSGLTTLITTSLPYYFDLDPAAGKIYWGNNGANLRSGPLAGGAEGPVIYGSGSNMRGVCVDVAGGMIYWCERGNRAVRRQPIGGGMIQTLYSGLDTPHGLVLDIPAGKLYWADTGTNGGGFNPQGICRGISMVRVLPKRW